MMFVLEVALAVFAIGLILRLFVEVIDWKFSIKVRREDEFAEAAGNIQNSPQIIGDENKVSYGSEPPS